MTTKASGDTPKTKMHNYATIPFKSIVMHIILFLEKNLQNKKNVINVLIDNYFQTFLKGAAADIKDIHALGHLAF